MKTLDFEGAVVFCRGMCRAVCPTSRTFAAILLIASSAMAQRTPGGLGPAHPSAKERAERQAIFYEAAVTTLERLDRKLQNAKQEREEILFRQLRLREKLLEHQLLPESVSAVMSALARDLIEVEVELYGKQGRIKSIERAIAIQAERLREEVGRDDVLEKLMQILTLRREAVKRTDRARQNKEVGDAEWERAQANLAESELRVAMRKSELAAAGGTASLVVLNEQLRSTTIDLAELEAKRDYISTQLENVRPLIELGLEHDRIAESDLRRAEQRIRDLEDSLRLAADKANSLHPAAAKPRQEQAKQGDSPDGTSSKD